MLMTGGLMIVNGCDIDDGDVFVMVGGGDGWWW
jgi:hypothetical protein